MQLEFFVCGKGRPLLWICDVAVSFLVPPDSLKNGTVKVLFFCSFTKLCNRQAVPFLGPCLGSFLKFFVSGLQKRKVLVSMKLCGLWRPEGQLGRPCWAKPVLRRCSGPRIGSVGASCFVDGFVLVGASGVHIGCCLNPLVVSFLLFRCVWWLDCLPLKEGSSVFCSP